MEILSGVFLGLIGTGYMLNNDTNDNKMNQDDIKPQYTQNRPSGNPTVRRTKSEAIRGTSCQKFPQEIPGTSCQNKPHQEIKYGSQTIIPKQAEPISVRNTTTPVTPFYYNTPQLTGNVDKIPNSEYNPELAIVGISENNGELKVHSLAGNNSELAKDTNVTKTTMDYSWDSVKAPSKWEELPHDPSHLEETEMVHTNMVPFYRGSITQNVDPNNRLNAQKLEIYTGNFALRRDNKSEIEQFFAPTTGLGNVYGNVEQRDLDRYKPNNTGKKNNELPFNQEIVGRALNGGYNAEPSGGFHDFTRIMPKTNDQMYVNPKIEAKGMINAGKNPIDKRTLLDGQYKYRQTLLVNNEKGQRNFTTVGQVTGRKLRPNIMMRDTNRKSSRMVMGSAAPATRKDALPSEMLAKVQKSRKTNFNNTAYRNAMRAEGKGVNNFGKEGYENKPNERMVTGSRSVWTNLKSVIEKAANYFSDPAKETKKQEYEDNIRQSGNMVAQMPSKMGARDTSMVAKTTIRQTTEAGDYMGITNVLGAGKGKAYDPNHVARTTVKETLINGDYVGITKQLGAGQGPAYDPNQIARTTIKETTLDGDYVGITKQLGAGQGPAYDPNQIAKTTIKETTLDGDYVGITKQLGAGQGPAYDPSQVAKTTIKETTLDGDYMGITKQLGAGKGKAFDPNQVAKTTIKQTTMVEGHNGQVSNPIQKKSIAWNSKEKAKTTIKQTTLLEDYKGTATNAVVKRSIAYDPHDLAKNTQRQFTEDYARTQSAGPAQKVNARLYDDAYNAETHTNMEEVAKGRAPGKVGVMLTDPLRNFQNMESKRPLTYSVNQRAHMKNSVVNNGFNPNAISKCTNTSVKNNLPEVDTRLDSTILDAFKNNPLTQSLTSYA
jgi:hypothetical protein